MKRLSVLLLLLLTGCASDKVAEVEESEIQEVAVEEVVEVEEVEEVEVEVVEESEVDEVEVELDDVIDRDSRITMAYVTLEKNFEGMARIDYDETNDTMRIIPTDQNFTMEILFMMSGVTGTEEWDALVENFQTLSESMSGLVDEDIMLSLVNPENEENTILLVQNGYIIYNLSDEL